MKSTSENNEFLTGETINCNVDLIDGLNHKDFLEFKKLNENILMYKEVSREIYKGVYFSGNKSPKVPILEGRYFSKEDFNKNEKLAVVGREKAKICVEKDGKKYFSDDSGEYLVIGVMGYKEKNTTLDYVVHFNLNSIYNNPEVDFSSGNYSIDSGKDTKETVKKFQAIIRKRFPLARITTYKNEEVNSSLGSLLTNAMGANMIIILIVTCISLNTISLTTNWINQKRKELGIRKAYGGTDKQIRRRILIEYEIVITFSFLLGFIISVIAIKAGLIKTFGREIYITSSFIAYLLCIVIGGITAKIPMKKAEKLEVCEIMR